MEFRDYDYNVTMYSVTVWWNIPQSIHSVVLVPPRPLVSLEQVQAKREMQEEWHQYFKISIFPGYEHKLIVLTRK